MTCGALAPSPERQGGKTAQSPRAGKAADLYYKGAEGKADDSPKYAIQAVRERLTPDKQGTLLIMVGLPARGKSFISRKVERFLQWKGMTTRAFNVGRYRREAQEPEKSGRADFFSKDNSAAFDAREAAATAAMADALSFLERAPSHGSIAIIDATNSTVARRRRLIDQVTAHKRSFHVVFVEVICNDAEVVEANLLNKVRHSPDFHNMPESEALADIKARIRNYEDVYETVQDEEGAFIKLYDLSSKVMANHCYGKIARSVVPFLMATHVGSRPIWLVRAGAGQVDGDRLSKLSTSGRTFATSLAAFVRTHADAHWRVAGKAAERTHIFSSTMPRAVASVSYATLRHEPTSALNPIDKGVVEVESWGVECTSDDPPWADIQRRYPEFWASFQKDPLRTRFPGGESYLDVLRRLEGLLIEIEMCTRPVLVVSHLSVLQLLVAYFRGTPIEEAWTLGVRRDTVITASPSLGGGFLVEELPLLGEELPDEHRFLHGGPADVLRAAAATPKNGHCHLEAHSGTGGEAPLGCAAGEGKRRRVQ